MQTRETGDWWAGIGRLDGPSRSARIRRTYGTCVNENDSVMRKPANRTRLAGLHDVDDHRSPDFLSGCAMSGEVSSAGRFISSWCGRERMGDTKCSQWDGESLHKANWNQKPDSGAAGNTDTTTRKEVKIRARDLVGLDSKPVRAAEAPVSWKRRGKSAARGLLRCLPAGGSVQAHIPKSSLPGCH